MPIHATSTYGHKAIFHTEKANQSDITRVKWTRNSIEVPCDSPLNTTAEVYLHIPDAHPTLAAAWCHRNGLQYTGTWRERNKRYGFSFCAPGFSRYRYDETDDEPAAPPPQGKASPEHATRRPRMSTRAMLADLDISDEETLQRTSPLPLASHVDTPDLHRLRAALFDASRMADVSMESPCDSRMQFDTPDARVTMSDVKMLPFDMPSPMSVARPSSPPMPISSPVSRPSRASPFPLLMLPFPTLSDAISATHEGLSSDTGLLLGRSTRACVTTEVAHPVYAGKGPRNGFAITLQPIFSRLSKAAFSRLLRTHCLAWLPECGDTKGDAPHVPGLETAFVHDQVADMTLRQVISEVRECEEKGDENAAHACMAFSLLLSLYKRVNDDGDVTCDMLLLRRVATWAAECSRAHFQKRNVPNNKLRAALLALCVGDVDRAVDITVAAGHLRLAGLVARGLEAPRDALRNDVEAQLESYGLIERDEDVGVECEQLCRMLNGWEESSAVSVDERMILLVLAGHILPVVKFLDLSWYCLFVMHLLHGAGNCDETQSERISASVMAVEKSKIDTRAPHAMSKDGDVCFLLLRLFAETKKSGLMKKVFCTSGFGNVLDIMDYRFSWLLFQILRGLNPQTEGPRGGGVALAGGLSMQLRAAGLPLWGFYVLCSGGAWSNMLHETLMRDWDVMQDDEIELEGKMTAEMFLTDVLGVQSGWIFEAKALAARQRGDRMKECEMWVECRNDRGVDMAHDILMKHILPEAVVRHDVAQMELAYRVLTRIEDVGGASNWTSRGGLMLNYMRNIIHIPACNKLSVATIEQLRDLAAAVRRMSAAYERGSVVEKHAASVIADAVATEQRAHAIRGECVEGMVEDLDTLGCSRGVKIRIKEEYRMQMSNDMKASWRRFALSFPTYSASIARIENDAPATANV